MAGSARAPRAADAVDDAENEERRQFCESAIVRLAREFLDNN